MDTLAPVTVDEVVKLTASMFVISLPRDILPTSLLKTCISALAPAIAHMANVSCEEGCFRVSSTRLKFCLFSRSPAWTVRSSLTTDSFPTEYHLQDGWASCVSPIKPLHDLLAKTSIRYSPLIEQHTSLKRRWSRVSMTSTKMLTKENPRSSSPSTYLRRSIPSVKPSYSTDGALISMYVE